jgi:serine/threonine protein kinase
MINHENIIKYYNSFLDQDSIVIVMEYADGGDLA